jgi:hypothetical protein
MSGYRMVQLFECPVFGQPRITSLICSLNILVVKLVRLDVKKYILERK